MARLNSIDMQEREIGFYFKFHSSDIENAVQLFRTKGGEEVDFEEVMKKIESLK